MIKLLNGYLYSYARLRFTGLNTQEIFNKAYQNGIVIKNAVRTEYTQLEADVYRFQIKKLKKLLGNKYKITTVKKRGVVYKISAVKKRIALLLSLALAFSGIGFVFSRTWSVKVIGYHNEKAIVEIVKNSGMLGFKKGLTDKIYEVQAKISQSDKNILWNSISINGTVVEVYIKEDKTLKVEQAQAGNLVASKDCVIRNLIVHSGSGQVTNDTTVKKGQLLIEAKQKFGEEYFPCKAEGIARASVFYSDSVSVPINETVYIETGNVKNLCQIKFLGINVVAGGKNQFATSYKTTEEINTFFLPIKITKITYNQTQAKTVAQDKETLILQAQNQLLTKLNQQIPSDATIYKTDTTIFESDGVITVYTSIETIENVAVRG